MAKDQSSPPRSDGTPARDYTPIALPIGQNAAAAAAATAIADLRERRARSVSPGSDCEPKPSTSSRVANDAERERQRGGTVLGENGVCRMASL